MSLNVAEREKGSERASGGGGGSGWVIVSHRCQVLAAKRFPPPPALHWASGGQMWRGAPVTRTWTKGGISGILHPPTYHSKTIPVAEQNGPLCGWTNKWQRDWIQGKVFHNLTDAAICGANTMYPLKMVHRLTSNHFHQLLKRRSWMLIRAFLFPTGGTVIPLNIPRLFLRRHSRLSVSFCVMRVRYLS